MIYHSSPRDPAICQYLTALRGSEGVGRGMNQVRVYLQVNGPESVRCIVENSKTVVQIKRRMPVDQKMARQSVKRIFISAVSSEFGACRKVVTEWARASGYEPVGQEDLSIQSGSRTLVNGLHQAISSCDAVIHLVGQHYGFEPRPNNGENGKTRRSYTQIEFEIAKEHERQIFILVASPNYKSDSECVQTDEEAELQRQHRERLIEGNQLYYKFGSPDELLGLLSKIDIKPLLIKPSNLPLVGGVFVGRERLLASLRKSLVTKEDHVTLLTAKQVIHGLGGVGKTRLAVEYAKRFSNEYQALLFINADSPENLTRSLASLCGALILDLPEKDSPEQESQVAAALRWLRQHSGWFLVVDNVDTAEAAAAVESLVAKLDTGHVVITSRLSQWGDTFEELALDVISEAAAQEFLLHRTEGKRKSTSTDESEALALASDLGRLPLALEQAGAFIAKHRGSLMDYRSRWKQQEAKVLQWHDQRSMKYPASIATTWQTSFDQLGDDAKSLLKILCWLAPDPIPRKLLTLVPAAIEAIEFDVDRAVAELVDHSLLRWSNGEFDALELHRLVADITQARLTDSEVQFFLPGALQSLDSFVDMDPDDVRSWQSVFDPGRNHLDAAIQHAVEHEITTPTTRLMIMLGAYYRARAEFAIAEPLIRQALELDEKCHGGGHPDIARDLNVLVRLLLDTNRLSEAEPLMRQAIQIGEEHYGAEHSEVAIGLKNLASLLESTNRLEEAEPLMRRALAINETSFGAEHPEVAIGLNNLASLLHATNRLEEAEPLMRRALAVDEHSYGTEHPNVARSLLNLAQLLRSTNRLQEAEPLMRRALAIDEQSYGTEHPNVARDLNNLAQLLQATNRLEEAEPLMRRALSIDESSYGVEHPNVAGDLNNLAQLLQATNRLEEAEPLMRRTIKIYTKFGKATGHEHPHMQTALSNYCSILQEVGLSEDEALAKIQAKLKDEV